MRQSTMFILLAAAAIVLRAAALLAAQAGDAPPPDNAAVELAQDKGWPRQFETATHIVRVHQPQVDDWPNFDRIAFRAALVVSPKESEEKTYGIIVVSAATNVAHDERLVVLTDRKVESLEFSGVEPSEAEKLKAIVMEAMPPQKAQTVSLDRIIAEIDVSKTKVKTVEVNLAPPKIFTSEKPAVMVIFMGKPRFKPIDGNDLMAAVNTNWDVFLDPAATKYYLLNEESWLSTGDLEKGPWTPAAKLPEGLSKLPADANWEDVRKAVPGKPPTEIPVVFVSHEPAELILTVGAPEMEPLPGTKLMMVTNTENDLFYNSQEKQYYLLAAGRWFRAPAVAGPWAVASADLPEDFKNIPEDSDAGEVLASVPGTTAANEAVVMASIPNKATVNKTEVNVNVTYDGAPEFRPIETTTVQYAHNSPFNVFLVEGKYYCCHNAVWFEAAAPTGVWTVCTAVPAAIYTIPPTSPKHNVTYVYVYESTPTTVTTGYTAGYSGATVAATGAVMFGLGMLIGAAIADDDDDCCWHYHYNSCSFSYGSGAVWHGHHGGYVSAGHRYGPYGGAGGFASYNPHTGVYSRGAYAHGPHGSAGFRTAYNPSTGNAGYRAGHSTPYGSWSRGAVSDGDDWVRGGQVSGARGSIGGIQTSEGSGIVRAENRYGNGFTVAKDKDGDVYAGRDGNVYKRDGDEWEQQSRSSVSANSASSGERPARDATNNNKNERPSNTSAQRAKPSAEQTQYLQKKSSSRQRGEKNVSRSRESRSSGGARPSRSGGGGGRRR